MAFDFFVAGLFKKRSINALTVIIILVFGSLSGFFIGVYVNIFAGGELSGYFKDWSWQVIVAAFIGSLAITGLVAVFNQLSGNPKTRYAELIEYMPNMFFSLDKSLKIKNINKACEKFAGISADDAIGKTPMELFPGYSSGFVPFYKEVLKTRVSKQFVSEYIFNNNNYIADINIYPTDDGISILITDITEQRNSIEALKKSETRYRQIAETAQEGIWLIDEENNTTFVNKKMSDIMGYSINELMGKQIHGFMDNEGRENGAAQIERRKKGVNENHDAKFITKDGIIVWANISTNAIFNEKGEYKGALAMITDITERRQAEELLKQSNDRFELVMKATDDAIWDWDILNDTLYCSNAYQKLFGYSPDISVQLWIDRIHPDDMTMVMDGIKKEMNDPDTDFWQGEYRYIRNDGSVAYIYDRGYIIHDEQKRPVRMVGAMQDITERKLSELALMESENQIQHSFAEIRSASERQLSIINSLNAHIALIDESGRILEVNESWKIFEAENEQEPSNMTPIKGYIPGAQNGHFIDKKSSQALASAINDCLAGRLSEFSLEYSYNLADGVKWFRANLMPLYQNRHGGLVISHTNITERKIAEMETLELIEVLKKKNKDLRQFAFVISHNLRAPVAKILGLVSLFKSNTNDKMDNTILLDYVAQEAENLDEVVKDLNEIVTISESSLKKEYTCFKDEFQLSVQALDSDIKESKAVITTDFEHFPGVVIVKSYLYNIIFNLLSNAIKYRRLEIAPVIHIKTGQEEKYLYLSITDNGLGIDLNRAGDKIFGLYKRFHGSSIKGKGAALSIVKVQVESMGGKIEVESQPGAGSSFKVFFPR